LRCRGSASRQPNGPAHMPDIVSELTLVCRAGRRDAQLFCRTRQSQSSADRAEFFTALIDITDRKRLEAGQTKTAEECATLARRLLSVQEEERNRIARDLHDNIGQQITSLRLMLDVMSMAHLDDTVRARIGQSFSIVQQLDRHLDF